MTFYHDWISVKEGIDTKTDDHLDRFIDESISKKCNGCFILFYNKNNFNYRERICKRCHKILLNTVFEPRNIYIIWWNNCKYRVLTTLKRGQARDLMEKVKVQDRYRQIDIDNLVEI